MAGRLSAHFHESSRGKAENGFENAGEMEGVGKPGFFGHLFNEDAGELQAFRGVVHLEPNEEAVG